MIGILRDVTKKREYEKKQRQIQRLESIGILAEGISHDFNNILTAIIGYAHIVKQELGSNHSSIVDIGEIIKGGNRAKELVRQILTFSTEGYGDFSPVKLQTVLKESIGFIRATLPTSIKIKTDFDMKCLPILADATQIHQIIMNLCTNSLHAMEEVSNGILKVSLKMVSIETKKLENDGSKPGQYVIISVIDNGCGINSDIIDKIFDPYFSTKNKAKGSGLGLSVVHGIVKNHSGFVDVKSHTDQGTTINISIPCIKQNFSEKTIKKKMPRGTEKIICVDDEETILFMKKKILSSLGYEVVVTTDSMKVLNEIKQDIQKYDLVLTDQTMPGMSGIELSKELLKVSPTIPIIISTGYSSISEKTFLENGIKAVLYKPMSPSELAVAVREVLDNNKKK